MLSRATDRNGPLNASRAERAAARGHGARNRKESLAIGQFQPLRHDLARRLEDSMNRPQRAGASLFGKREACAI
jgi:hypothetical protein